MVLVTCRILSFSNAFLSINYDSDGWRTETRLLKAKNNVIFKHVYNHILCMRWEYRACTVGWCHCFEWDAAADSDVTLQGLTLTHSHRVYKTVFTSWKIRWEEIEGRSVSGDFLNKPDSNPFSDKSGLHPSCFLLPVSHTQSSQRLLSVSPHLA